MRFERVDRVPLLEVENYEVATVERWRKEGLPADQSVADFLELDTIEHVPVDMWALPRFEREVIAEDDEYTTVRDEMGIVTRAAKANPTMIYIHLDHPVKTRSDWEKLKERFDPKDPRRFPPDWGTAAFERYNASENPVGLIVHPFFFRLGYYFMGTTNFMLAFYDDPALLHDMFSFWAEFCIALTEDLLANVQIDFAAFAEDLAYKNSSHISPQMYAQFWMPYQVEFIRLLKRHGVPTISLWSSGDIRPILPLAIEAGYNATWPLESMVGFSAPDVRREYGNSLALAGNIAIGALIEGKDAIRREVETKVAPLLDGGGFLPTVDDMTPPEVPFENYVYYINLLRELM